MLVNWLENFIRDAYLYLTAGDVFKLLSFIFFVYSTIYWFLLGVGHRLGHTLVNQFSPKLLSGFVDTLILFLAVLFVIRPEYNFPPRRPTSEWHEVFTDCYYNLSFKSSLMGEYTDLSKLPFFIPSLEQWQIQDLCESVAEGKSKDVSQAAVDKYVEEVNTTKRRNLEGWNRFKDVFDIYRNFFLLPAFFLFAWIAIRNYKKMSSDKQRAAKHGFVALLISLCFGTVAFFG